MKKMLLGLVAIGTLYAQDFTKIQDSQNLALTIYNNNLAMVNEERLLNIPQDGKNRLIYEGVASSVIFESIIPYFSKPTTLYSQNYHYDTLSLNKLLEKHINKTIRYRIKTAPYEYMTQEAVLLSTNPILVKQGNEIFSGIKPEDIVFTKIPEDLITKPSLVWNTQSQRGEQSIKLNYLTRNISWKSDYVLNLDKENRLNGWITITNNSGVNYNNATIYCIAGDVNTSQPEIMQRNMMMKAVAYDSASFQEVSQKAFAGYQMYTIPFKESINNKEKKQINFISQPNIKVTSKAINAGSVLLHRFSAIKDQKFNHQLELTNSKNKGLGIPLPKGTIRVYKKDEQLSHFIGQSQINHTSVDEDIKLTIGKFFDITQDIEQLEHKKSKYNSYSKYKRTIKNKTDKTQSIEVIENLYNSNIREVQTTNNCKGSCQSTKEGLNSYKYTITLKPKASYELIVDYDVEYGN